MKLLFEYLKDRMEQNQDKRITSGNQSITYGELIQFSCKHYSELNQKKYAIRCSNVLDTIKALFTCFCASRTAIILSEKYGQVHCEKVISKTKPNAIISDGFCIETNKKLNILETLYDTFRLKNVQLLMCTSGTTKNLPKAAMITHKNLICNLLSIEEYFKLNSSDKILIIRPVYHCAVLTGEFLISLVLGVNVFFYDEDFDPYRIIEIIKMNGITTIGATPSLIYQLSRIVAKKSISLPLINLVLSGESLHDNVYRELRKAFPNVNVYSVYGLTEASPRVLYLPPDKFNNNYSSVGVPVKNCKVKITDNELCVKSPSVMKGYYNDYFLTKKTIRNRWLHTGDIATLNSQGYIEIKGRMDDMIIKNGINIYPLEIVNAILNDQNISEVHVYSTQSTTNNPKIHMKVVCSYKKKSEVFDSCKRYLPIYQYPDYIEIVDTLPKNASGKVKNNFN